jgi:hypothetical protein
MPIRASPGRVMPCGPLAHICLILSDDERERRRH